VFDEGISLDIEAFRYINLNPYFAYKVMKSQTYYTAVAYDPLGTDIAAASWYCPYFCWESYSEDFDASQGFLILRGRGQSSGPFSRPTI
jgi:hypothetical protein